MNQLVQRAKQQNTRLARALVQATLVVNVMLLVLMCVNASKGGVVALVLLAVLVDFGVGSYAASQGLGFELLVESKWK